MLRELQDRTILVAGSTGPFASALMARLAAEGAAVRSSAAARAAGQASDADTCAGVDVLVNVIPETTTLAFLETSEADMKGAVWATLGDAVRWSQAAGRAMAKSGRPGTIVNVVWEPRSTQLRAALFGPMIRRGSTIALSKALAGSLIDQQIQVNTIVGPAGPDAAAQDWDKLISATVFLCAAHGVSVTGETILVGDPAQAYDTTDIRA